MARVNGPIVIAKSKLMMLQIESVLRVLQEMTGCYVMILRNSTRQFQSKIISFTSSGGITGPDAALADRIIPPFPFALSMASGSVTFSPGRVPSSR